MIKSLRPGITVLLAATIAVLVACAVRSEGKRDVVVQISKHDACIICHRLADPPEDGLPSFPPGIDPVAFCLDCHHYTENHHPVDIVPTEAYLKKIPGTYPLFAGKITCLTCHEAHTGPDRVEPPELLRGGPYTDRRDICFRCHSQDTYAKINPHVVRASGGAFKEIAGKSVCLVCHAKVPELDSGRDEVQFKADIAFLCWRCHHPMPGDFLQKHFHRKPAKKTLSSMGETEGKLGLMLPLAKDGRVTCSTCHNPHQPGVLVNKAALYGAGAPGRLRLPKDVICSACHMFQQQQTEVKQTIP